MLSDAVRDLARWVLRHPLIRKNYALGGGSWLMLRHPQKARPSTDVDVFSAKEDVSSYRAMLELIETCKREGIPHEIIRRGEHFCQIFIEYPLKGSPIKVDIGKIWHGVNIEFDDKLKCPMLSPGDMAAEKLRCVVNRIEPTDLYDLCLLRQEYPSEFTAACLNLKVTNELQEFLSAANSRLEILGASGTKLGLDVSQTEWLTRSAPLMILEITTLAIDR